MRSKVVELISEVLELEVEQIKDISDSDSLRMYSLNSITAIKLIVKLECEFQISIEDSMLTVEAVETIENILNLIKHSMGSNC